MRYIFMTGLALLLFVSSAGASETTLTAVASIDSVMLKGYIIDNLSASIGDSAELSDLLKVYSKEKALLPERIKSGYSLFSEDKLYRFDEISNIKIREFLQKPDSGLRVTVMAKRGEGEVSLVSVENQR